jgi:hypothetical protein
MKKSTIMIAIAVVLMCAGITAIVLGGCAKSGDAGSAASEEAAVLEATPISESETTVADFPTAPEAEDKAEPAVEKEDKAEAATAADTKEDATAPATDDSKEDPAPQPDAGNTADVSGGDVSGADVSGGDASGN